MAPSGVKVCEINSVFEAKNKLSKFCGMFYQLRKRFKTNQLIKYTKHRLNHLCNTAYLLC